MNKECKRLKEELEKARLLYQKAEANLNNYLDSLYKQGDTLVHECSPRYIKVLNNYGGTAKVVTISSNVLEIKWIDTAILAEYNKISKEDFKKALNRTIGFITNTAK